MWPVRKRKQTPEEVQESNDYWQKWQQDMSNALAEAYSKQDHLDTYRQARERALGAMAGNTTNTTVAINGGAAGGGGHTNSTPPSYSGDRYAGQISSGSYTWKTGTSTTTTNKPIQEWQLPYPSSPADLEMAALVTKVDEMNDKLEAAWELINELAGVIDSLQEDS